MFKGLGGMVLVLTLIAAAGCTERLAVVSVKVVDQWEGTLPGVTATGMPDGQAASVDVSDAYGRIELLLRPSANTSLDFALDGFRTFHLTGVPTRGGHRLTLPPVTLEIGSDDQQVSWTDWDPHSAASSSPLPHPIVALLEVEVEVWGEEELLPVTVSLEAEPGNKVAKATGTEGVTLYVPEAGFYQVRIEVPGYPPTLIEGAPLEAEMGYYLTTDAEMFPFSREDTAAEPHSEPVHLSWSRLVEEGFLDAWELVPPLK